MTPIRHLTIAIFAFTILASSVPAGAHARAPNAVGGVLDLSGWNFEKDGTVPLDGEWDFYWSKLLSTQEAAAGQPGKTHIRRHVFLHRV